MTELSLNRPAGILVKTTCVDYPGIVAGSFFLKGCNLRCPYCYNAILVVEHSSDENLNTVQELFDHLEKRKDILEGLTISGGEPLLNPYTPLIIKKAKSLGYKVKLDTNGTFPEKLEKIISTPELKPDFIAMDIKTSPENYMDKLCGKSYRTFGNTDFTELLKKSIEIITTYPPESREWRTVLVPGLIKKNDIKRIASLLPDDAAWRFAEFKNENCIDSSYNELPPYSDRELHELIDYAKSLIKDSELR